MRSSAKSRYRQWMTHKLGSWIDQFGTSGCVGCGRCLTWCPVGIDITEEVAAIRADPRPAADTEASTEMRSLEQLLIGAPVLRRARRLDGDAAGRAAPPTCTSGPGEYLFHEGEPADRFFVVRAGAWRSTCTCPAGGARHCDTVDEGDVVGWSWLVPPYRWFFDARAVHDVRRSRSTRRACAPSATRTRPWAMR